MDLRLSLIAWYHEMNTMGRLNEAVKNPRNKAFHRYGYVREVASLYFVVGYRALDVGTNDGTFAHLLAEIGYETVGVDIKVQPQVSSNYKFRFASVEYEARFRSKLKYQFIHVGQVLEHVEDPKTMLEAVLKLSDGLVVISVPSFRDRNHLRVYDEEKFREHLSPYFIVEDMKIFGKRHRVYIAKCRRKDFEV